MEIVDVQFRNFKEESTPVVHLKQARKKKRGPRLKITRDELGNGIAHYQFELRLGNREFDVVRLHRVVREVRPYRPIRTESDIFMIHGSIQDFDDIFLTAGAENVNRRTSLPVNLALGNIDVWGVDLAWTLVPPETTDFTFMKDWGIDRDIDHTRVAMSFARLIRGFTIRNFSKMNLLGFSYSVKVVYGAAGRESQKHPVLRNIKGLIPVEAEMKYAPEDEEFRLNACNAAADTKELLDNGNYQYDAGVTFAFLGNLALTAPNDPSPVPDFAGLTNNQVMLFLGTMTYQTGNPSAPFWHFIGGDLESPFYTGSDRWLRLAVSLAPYQPRRQLFESNACSCDEVDVSFDDHLSEISVPVFYLGAGGGMGALGEYTSSLTASTDITHYTVSVNENRRIDYGHADLFLGENADELAWEVLLDWLVDHAVPHI